LLLKSIRLSGRKQAPGNTYAAVEHKLLALAAQILHAARLDSESFAQYLKAGQLPKTPPRNAPPGSVPCMTQPLLLQNPHSTFSTWAPQFSIGHQVQFRVLPIIRADERACVELISAMNIIARANTLSNLARLGSADRLINRLD
jgi:hypothetical protein